MNPSTETFLGLSSDNADYQHPGKQCDLIMKGGVTSGVVYPPAILELAQEYRFRSVGGTSAGAIAAAAAAAAEYGRDKKHLQGAGFAGLYQMMMELQQEDFLINLFQPGEQAHTFFNALIHSMDVSDAWKKNAKGSAVLALARVCLGIARRPIRFYRGVRHVFAGDASFFGLCTGKGGVPFNRAQAQALTPWLHSHIQQLAGLDSRDVLTIGMLRKKQPGKAGEEDVSIDFQMVTTNLSQRQPYTLHGEDPKEAALKKPHPEELEAGYLFKESDMLKLFPQEMVEYLKTWTEREEYREQWARDKGALEGFTWKGYYPFPRGNALPVLVATRMSLSFPLLLSAVRLYTIKSDILKRRPGKADAPHALTAQDLKENWFSDGGIASNFPIHIFDAWLPTRPTFGINLADSQLPTKYTGPRESPVHRSDEDVFLPRPSDFITPRVYPISSVRGFLGAIFDTAQNYRDNMQARLPSYRERVVDVRLQDNEGGLNLRMDPKTIEGIAKKGQQAAQALKTLDFSQHRWVRLLVLLARLEREFFRLQMHYEKETGKKQKHPSADAWRAEMLSQYQGLLNMQLEEHHQGRDWYRHQDEEQWRDEALERMRMLIELISQWTSARPVQGERQPTGNGQEPEADGHPYFFAKDEPFPECALRVTPES